MAKILKEKGFNDVLPGQKLRRQCVTEYEKLTKPPENENMTKISWVNIHGVAQHSQASNAKGKLKKVLNVYKENISAAYFVSDIEIEEPPPMYEGEISHRFKYRKIANIDFGSWFLVTKVLFWILWSFRVFNSICKRTEAKKVDTSAAFPEKR